MKIKTLIKSTSNNTGLIIPAGTLVQCEVVRGSDLVKCKSKDYGFFYTNFLNVK